MKTPRTIHEWNKFNELVGGFNSIFFLKSVKVEKIFHTVCIPLGFQRKGWTLTFYSYKMVIPTPYKHGTL